MKHVLHSAAQYQEIMEDLKPARKESAAQKARFIYSSTHKKQSGVAAVTLHDQDELLELEYEAGMREPIVGAVEIKRLGFKQESEAPYCYRRLNGGLCEPGCKFSHTEASYIQMRDKVNAHDPRNPTKKTQRPDSGLRIHTKPRTAAATLHDGVMDMSVEEEDDDERA